MEEKTTKEEKQENKEGTEQDWREKLAHTIAGDNELIKNTIKFCTNPLVMLTGAIAIVFLIIRGKDHKDNVALLKAENERLKEKIIELTELNQELKQASKEIAESKANDRKSLNEGNRFSTSSSLSPERRTVKRYQSKYLD